MLANAVRETTTTTGTGTLNLAGAVTGFHAFRDKFVTGSLVRYTIRHRTADEQEYGLGTLTHGTPDTLARTAVLGGSNGTSAVTFTAGTMDVFCDALKEDLHLQPGRISGKRYIGMPHTYATTGTVTLDTLFAIPFWVGSPCAFDGICIAALGTGSAFARLGLYADSRGRPGALIVDAGQVDCASGGEKVASITQTLSGWVWLAYVGQGVTPSVTKWGIGFNPMIGVASVYATAGGVAYSQTGVSGALPSTWGATYTEIGATSGTVPCVYLRVA